MFERYNINDLFLASINVIYPDNDMCDINIGNMLMMQTTGYGYSTILTKNGNKFIDLQNMSRKITTTRNPRTTSYIIEYTEPLSKYYTQEGKKKKTFSKRKAIINAKKYFNTMHKEHFAQLERQSSGKSLVKNLDN